MSGPSRVGGEGAAPDVTISTHVLDASRGAPARGMRVTLFRLAGVEWEEVGSGPTDEDGRCPGLTTGVDLGAGTYRLRFETGAYFARIGLETFYPVAELTFSATNAGGHYHVPLLLSPFAYSTYRGS